MRHKDRPRLFDGKSKVAPIVNFQTVLADNLQPTMVRAQLQTTRSKLDDFRSILWQLDLSTIGQPEIGTFQCSIDQHRWLSIRLL